MKWLLVVIVMNTPLKTDLIFNSLEACLLKEFEMRKTWSEQYNKSLEAKKNSAMTPQELAQSNAFMSNQITTGTCIPTK